MDTLFNTENNNQKHLIGAKLHILLKNSSIEIFRNQEFIELKPIKTSFEKRLAIVELIRNFKAMKKPLAIAMGVSRQSIDTWLKSYEKYGAEGLINNTKDSYKRNPKRFTGNKARELENDRLQEVEKLEAQKLLINFNAVPQPLVNIRTDLYTDTYGFEDNRYAGSMLVIAMIESLYHISSFAPSFYQEQTGFIYLFLAMQINQIDSVEQLKVVNKHEFGKIIGQKKLSSMPNIWSEIHQGVEKGKSQEFGESVFNYQAINGLVSLDFLAIDGHFIPYYGKEKIHKGFFTQRDLMMKGQTQIFVHDSNGRVVYFETQEGKGNIVETLKKASEYIGRLNNGQKPLMAVDREIWGVENFIYLNEERVVTWEKFKDSEELKLIDINLFTDSLDKNGRSWLLYEQKQEYSDAKKNKITMRRVIIHNQETGQRLSMVTNDKIETKIIVADCMLNRWGSNENSFKYMGERTNMHYNPVIEIAKESQNQEIDNPQYKQVHKELTANKNKLSKIEHQLGKIPISENKDGSLRQNQKREQLKNTCETVKEEIKKVKKELEIIPKRIDIGEIADKKFKEIDKEGINIWTICESLFWNSRKELILRFSQYLPDVRDTIPVLEALIKAKGRIQSTAKTILVKLETCETPRYKSAQIQLMRYMNNLDCRINNKLLKFEIMSI